MFSKRIATALGIVTLIGVIFILLFASVSSPVNFEVKNMQEYQVSQFLWVLVIAHKEYESEYGRLANNIMSLKPYIKDINEEESNRLIKIYLGKALMYNTKFHYVQKKTGFECYVNPTKTGPIKKSFYVSYDNSGNNDVVIRCKDNPKMIMYNKNGKQWERYKPETIRTTSN